MRILRNHSMDVDRFVEMANQAVTTYLELMPQEDHEWTFGSKG